MKRYHLKANAKLNLYININFKNEYNYHDLTMLNIPINLFDTLNVVIDENREDTINLKILNNLNVETNENNLIYKAVKQFKELEKKQFYYECRIFKEIPIKSGTGGASSNAAVVLKNLYKHFKIEISKNELVKKYVNLGADIPFFIYNKSSIVEGIGEKITPIDLNLKKFYFVLIHPNFNESTSDVYSKLDAIEKQQDNGNINTVLNQIKDNWDFSGLKNDFMQVLNNKKYDKIKDVLISNGAEFVNVTGTGSTMFAIFKKEINAKNLNNNLQKEYKNVFICQTLGESNE